MASKNIPYLVLIDIGIGLLGLSQACPRFIAAKITFKYMNLWRGQMVKIDRVIDKRQHHAEVEEFAMTSVTPARLNLWMCAAFIIGWIVVRAILFWFTFVR